MVCVGCRFSKNMTNAIKITESVINRLKKPNIPTCKYSLKKNISMDRTSTNNTTLTVFFSLITLKKFLYLCKKYRFQKSKSARLFKMFSYFSKNILRNYLFPILMDSMNSELCFITIFKQNT